MRHADCFGDPMPLKVLLLDEDPDRAATLREALVATGYEVVSSFTSSVDLYDQVKDHAPDMIIIDTESPSRDVLEHITFISRDQPRPIVMFSADRESETIRSAVRAGVTAYVVDGLSEARVHPILQVAVERFEAEQTLRQELADAKSQLAERKLVERAKGVIMKQKNVDEEEAFRTLRKFAMDRGIRMADAADQVIQIAKVLG
jgi:two-component system, response regulator / RNA-binding antiterminator